MTRIAELGPKFEHLPAILAEYDDDLANVEGHLQVKGKTLEQALKEQASWPFWYDDRRAEVKALLKFMESKVQAVRGKLARQYVENYSRQLNERTMNAYIDSEAEYLSISQLYLEIDELYEKYTAVIDAFTKRGFALRDMTALRIHSMENVML